MKVFKSIKDVPREDIADGYVATIGNFDGIHLGHQKLIGLTRQKKTNEQKLLVFSFRPHPNQVIRPGIPLKLVNDYRQKVDMLESEKVDHFIEIPFSRDLSTTAPLDFLSQYINPEGKLRSLVVGYDFSFGANKSGSRELIAEYCKKNSINFYVADSFKLDGAPVSSTRIREDIVNHRVEQAEKLLGRPYCLSGLVVKGAGRGKQIGFPTANINYPNEKIIPGRGVYITKVNWKDLSFYAVTNIGKNPTFGELESLSVETHILDFDNDLYGDSIEIEFLAFLRSERKFESVNDLISQIALDVKDARDWFQNH